MTEIARRTMRDIRTIEGTFDVVHATLTQHRGAIEQMTPIEPTGAPGRYTAMIRLLPESPTIPIARARARVVPSPYPKVDRRRPAPRWVVWTLVVVALVALIALSCTAAVWLFTPDAPPAATGAAPAPDAHAHTDGAISGLLGLIAVLALLGLLWRWAFSGGKTFSGTFRGKMD